MIKLTMNNNKPVWLNAAHVVKLFACDDNSTQIDTSDQGVLYVKEDPELVVAHVRSKLR